jgi:hypothetical protein
MLRSHNDTGRPGDGKMGNTRKVMMVSAIAVLAVGCGPDASDDEPPGTLEYETPTAQFYRLDRRLDIVGVDPTVDRSGCGLLTDRAYEDLVETFDALDPNVDYDRSDCEYSPEGLVYIEGFTYSPFSCSWYCCHIDLLPIAVVYFAAGSTLYGPDPNINGETYVAIEPDEPCP